jgi:hypothetical protein
MLSKSSVGALMRLPTNRTGLLPTAGLQLGAWMAGSLSSEESTSAVSSQVLLLVYQKFEVPSHFLKINTFSNDA